MDKRAKGELDEIPDDGSGQAIGSLKARLGIRLKELRTSKKKKGYLGVRIWSKQDVAEKAGMSLSAYDAIERGKASPRLENLEAIAKALDVSLVSLLA